MIEKYSTASITCATSCNNERTTKLVRVVRLAVRCGTCCDTAFTSVSTTPTSLPSYTIKYHGISIIIQLPTAPHPLLLISILYRRRLALPQNDMTAPPLVEVDDSVVADLRKKLVDPNTSLPEKYRCLFSLRNVKGPAAHEALTQGRPSRQGPSNAVLKHIFLQRHGIRRPVQGVPRAVAPPFPKARPTLLPPKPARSCCRPSLTRAHPVPPSMHRQL